MKKYVMIVRDDFGCDDYEFSSLEDMKQFFKDNYDSSCKYKFEYVETLNLSISDIFK